jgi:uncharacterized LabA/DUF88 family protein
MEKDKKIAVLIDADNVSEKYIKYIIDEISNHGMPTYKRIYGDWTKPNLASWKSVLLNYSITPIQQYNYTTGKNSTDAALIIDAMDILYSGNVDGFCIVSSDSDFTKLAARLREAGMYVIGMGEKKTPTPFIAACEKFKYLEVLADMAASITSATAAASRPAENKKTAKEKQKQSGANGQKQEEQKPEEPKQEEVKPEELKLGIIPKNKMIEVIKAIIAEISDEDGWAFMGKLGDTLNKRYPDFDTRNYGFTKLTPFLKSLNRFEIRSDKTSNPSISLKYIKNT